MTERVAQANVKEAGFSLVELMIAMTVTLIVMGMASTMLTQLMGTRTRENRKSDALADAQRALNIMSRDIANSGYGLTTNGIVVGTSDSTQTRIHLRSNITNNNPTTTDRDEDVTYDFQSACSCIARLDRNFDSATTPPLIASPIDSLQFTYINIAPATGAVTETSAGTANTTRVRIAVSVTLPAAQGQPASSVTLNSDVALRNSSAVLNNF